MYVLQIYMSYWANEVQLVAVGRSYFTTMDMFHIFHPKNSKIGTIFTSYTCAFLLSKDAGVVLDKFRLQIFQGQNAPESFQCTKKFK